MNIRILLFALLMSPATFCLGQFGGQVKYTPITEVVQDDYDDEEDWEEGSGFSIGITIGAYFANKSSANLYNGSCLGELENDPSGVRCHTIEERLNLNINTIKYINDYYGSTAYEFPYDHNPWNMSYQPSFMYGLQIKYDFNYESGIFFNLNSMRVKTVDQFTMRFIGTTLPSNAQEDVRLMEIWGTEDRFQFFLGWRQSFFVNDGAYFYLEGAASMLGVRLRENKIRVAEQNYDLFIGSQNPNQLMYYQPRTEIGLGFGVGTGMNFTFDGKYFMDIGLMMSNDRVVLLNFEDKLWNLSLFGRFSI